MRGSRVQAVVNELQGEKIDIIPWSSTRRPSSLTHCSRGGSDEGGARRRPDSHRGRCSRHRRSRRSAMAKVDCIFTGWDIDILDGSRRVRAAVAGGICRAGRRRSWTRSTVDETVALLASRACRTGRRNALRRAARELATIEGFDTDTANEIHARKGTSPGSKPSLTTSVRLGVSDELKEIAGLTTPMLAAWRERRQDNAGGSRRLRKRRSGRVDRTGRQRRQRSPGF